MKVESSVDLFNFNLVFHRLSCLSCVNYIIIIYTLRESRFPFQLSEESVPLFIPEQML